MNTYRPKHFTIQELVPLETYQLLGDNSWIVLDIRAVMTLDQLRDYFGPCTVNNWSRGGNLQYRGFRPKDCTVGAMNSQHRFGRAFDCSFNSSADKVRQDILDNRSQFPYLSALEDEVSWVHFDVRDHGDESIKVFKP